MKIFLSYSQAQGSIAERLALSLRGDQHTVFFDRSDIEGGDEYDSRIRDAIQSCDLFIFLISPDSVAPGSYPLAELQIAKQRWNHPKGHVLPIAVHPVDIASVPPYLRAVSVLKPRGDIVAESSAAIARISGKNKLRLPRFALPVITTVLLLAAWAGYSRFERERTRDDEINRVIAGASTDLEAGQYSEGFRVLGEAAGRFPNDADIRTAREQAAMLWLRNIRVRTGEQTFSDVVRILRPVLSDGASSATGSRAADLLAHLGWCEYLRWRDGDAGADPVVYFKRAAEADASNPYAGAMWGFWILFRNGNLNEAKGHFAEAVRSGRERTFARNLQIAVLVGRQNPVFEAEAIRTANEMRVEQTPVEEPGRLWSIYEYSLLREQDTDSFLRIISTGEHLQTFRWLYPETSIPEDRLSLYRFLLGRLQEAASDSTAALDSYRWVDNRLREHGSPGTLMDRVAQGLRRLDR